MIISEAFEMGRSAFRLALPKCVMLNPRIDSILKKYVDHERTWFAEDYCAGLEYEANLTESTDGI